MPAFARISGMDQLSDALFAERLFIQTICDEWLPVEMHLASRSEQSCLIDIGPDQSAHGALQSFILLGAAFGAFSRQSATHDRIAECLGIRPIGHAQNIVSALS